MNSYGGNSKSLYETQLSNPISEAVSFSKLVWSIHWYVRYTALGPLLCYLLYILPTISKKVIGVFLLPLSYFSSISNPFWLFYLFLRVYIYAFKYMYISYYMISFPHEVDFVDDTLVVQTLYFLQIGSWTQRLDQTHAPLLWQDYWWCHVLKRGTYNVWLSFFFFSVSLGAITGRCLIYYFIERLNIVIF